MKTPLRVVTVCTQYTALNKELQSFPKKLNQEKKQTIEADSQMRQLLELSDNDFKIFINNMLKKKDFHKRTAICKQSDRNLRIRNE